MIPVFSEKPAVPPSVAQMGVIATAMDRNFGRTLNKLVTNVNYMLLMVCYGMINGSPRFIVYFQETI